MAVVQWLRHADSSLLSGRAARGAADGAAGVFVELLQGGTEAAAPEAYLARAMPRITQALGAESTVLAALRADGGGQQWGTLFEDGRLPGQGVAEGSSSGARLPRRLLAEVLDRGAAAFQPAEAGAPAYCAVPLDARAQSGEVLVAAGTSLTGERLDLAVALTHYFALALADVRRRAHQATRIRQLESVLAVSAQLNTMREMEPLLVRLAEEATRLLACDRASIFIWDRPNKQLVARPALGVEGNELRLPDERGVVGEVVQSGRARRVDDAQTANSFSAEIDSKLAYRTRNLLCVPLVDPKGAIIGAFEALNKRAGAFTADDQELLEDLARQAAVALENTQEREDLLTARRLMTETAAGQVRIVGESPAIAALRSTIERVAQTNLPVLVLGESGTGKEVVAQAIHYRSARRDKPLVAVNCAALTETLLENELFGHEKGAYTDAREAAPGKFELASGGTIFLDEIGDLSPGGQAKLLRVLEQKVVTRVGGTQPIHTDARVIAATNKQLADLVRQKKFREDLFYRLTVVTLDLPPLRERPDDVLPLAEYFLERFSRDAGRKGLKLTSEARRRLQAHAWPGNVRELRNLMERLAFLCPNDRVEAGDLAFILTSPSEAKTLVPLDQALSDATHTFQRTYIEQAIARVRGNMSDAARLLGLHRSNLYRKMRQLGMDTSGVSGEEE